jgi:hypothetical protein
MMRMIVALPALAGQAAGRPAQILVTTLGREGEGVRGID